VAHAILRRRIACATKCTASAEIRFVEGPRSRSIYPHDRGGRFLTRNGVGPVLYRWSIHRTQTLATLPRTLLLVDSALRWRALELLASKLREQERSGGALRRKNA
jgi:hypothetical protein